MYKTLGDYSWLGTHSLNATEHLTPPASPAASQSEDGDSILQSAHQFSLALNSLKDVSQFSKIHYFHRSKIFTGTSNIVFQFHS